MELRRRYGKGTGKVIVKPHKNTAKYRDGSTRSLNSALERMDRLTPQPLYQGERIALTTEQGTVWTPQPVGTLWRRCNSSAPTRIRILDRPVRSPVTRLARQSSDACRTCRSENSTVRFPLPCPALPCPAQPYPTRPVTQMTPRCVSPSCVAGPPTGIPETQFWRLCARSVHSAQLCVQQHRELDLETTDRLPDCLHGVQAFQRS